MNILFIEHLFVGHGFSDTDSFRIRALLVLCYFPYISK